jgi:hypothetical protein
MSSWRTRGRLPVLLLLAAGLSLPAIGAVLAAETDWTTDYERSGGLRTPRYEETVRYCRRLAEASPRLHYTTFGTSPEGRELPLVIYDDAGLSTPADADRAGRAVVLVEACIHAGECCGKDAGLMLLRDWTVGDRRDARPRDLTVLFIPILNVDGHERFSPYGRINQDGPEEMGWRVNARNLNLNRDFLKADTPEMQDWLRLFTAWRPDFFVDVHSTDGADYQYAISYSLELHGNLDPELTAWARDTYLPFVEAEMAEAGFPLIPYVMFRRWHDPQSGLRGWAASPRLSQGYAALQNVPGLLVETHMLKPYAVRVDATYALLDRSAELLDREAARLRDLAAGADRRAASAGFRTEPFPLRFAATGDSVMIDFLGVEYETVTSALSGGDWFRYHPDRPVTYRIPYFDDLAPSVTTRLPEAYLVPPAWDDVIDRLELHGVRVDRLSRPAELTVRTCRFRDVAWAEEPYEGRQTVSFTAEPLTETRLFAAGTAVVDMAQRAARVAAHVLEPEAPDSYVQWGFFAPVFSRVEYVESYVIEAMMEEMVAADPALLAELEARKSADPEFAANPWAIRYWFYEKTPYYDQRVNIYPVAMLDDRAAVAALPLR